MCLITFPVSLQPKSVSSGKWTTSFAISTWWKGHSKMKSFFKWMQPGRYVAGSESGMRCRSPSDVKVRIYEMSKKVNSGHFEPSTSRCSFLHCGKEVRQFLEDRMSSDKLGTLDRTSVNVLLNASKTPELTVPMLSSPEKSNLVMFGLTRWRKSADSDGIFFSPSSHAITKNN